MRSLEGFDAHIVETHHSRKKDAPSGTAIAIAKAASDALDRPIPTTSIRTGAVPGTHELLFDGAFEQLSLTHVARARRPVSHSAPQSPASVFRKKCSGPLPAFRRVPSSTARPRHLRLSATSP